jgi:Family of unknown function (DUF5677)
MKADSKAEIISRVEELSGRITHTSLAILAVDQTPMIPAFICTLMGYIATQGLRIVAWLKEPHVDNTDLIAHATRNIFETHLIYRHLMRGGGSEFMSRMVEELRRDDFDLLDGLVYGRLDSPGFPEDLKEHHSHLRAQNFKRTPTVRELAKESGCEEEYLRFYKLYSKYAHPSIYHLFGDRREVYSQTAIATLTERAVLYLEEAVEEFEKIRDIVLEAAPQA